MQKGYNSPAVKDLIADEPNYLGHGSNYAVLAQAPLRHVPEGRKLMVSLRHGGVADYIDRVADQAAALCDDILRDDVIATIAKPNYLPAQPRPVDAFLHMVFADAAAAQAAAGALAASIRALPRADHAACGLHRVATRIIVAAPTA
jgi:hypothetical protein